MADERGKVEIKVGDISFVAEGDQTWLAAQVEKVLAAAATIPAAQPDAHSGKATGGGKPSTTSVPPLGSFIKAKGADGNQTLRYLVTAAWLFKRGATSLTTTAVTKALSDNHQSKLGNPAQCLAQNVKNGHCEKTANGFFITPDGWTALSETP